MNIKINMPLVAAYKVHSPSTETHFKCAMQASVLMYLIMSRYKKKTEKYWIIHRYQNKNKIL